MENVKYFYEKIGKKSAFSQIGGKKFSKINIYLIFDRLILCMPYSGFYPAFCVKIAFFYWCPIKILKVFVNL